MTPRFLVIPCPWCGRINEAVTPLEEGTVPHAGAVSICFRCARLSIFDEDLELLVASEGERLRLQEDPRVLLACEYIREYQIRKAARKGMSADG